MSALKQVVGIDVAKDTLRIHFGWIDEQQAIHHGKSASFANTPSQFGKLMRWGLAQCEDKSVPLLFVMEATGVYYEALAYFLYDHRCALNVLVPKKLAHYAQTLDIKSKTDDLDARLITRFALERALPLWHKPSESLQTLRTLTREYQNLQGLLTRAQNQLHAKTHAHHTPKETVKRIKEQIRFYQKQLDGIEADLHRLVDQDTDLKNRIENIDSIQGVGFMTAVAVVAETEGFALVENGKQLASYSGLDVVHHQSGLRHGQTSISKRGNRFLRQAVFMPALAAIRFNPSLKEFYQRLIMRKNNKKIALIAVARKLLVLIYTIWKKNEPYDPNYYKLKLKTA